MEVLDFLSWVVLTYFFLRFLFSLIPNTRIIMTEDDKKILKNLDQIVRYVRLEHNNGIEYWFDGENNQFLAQGRTREEIISVLRSRFPKYIFLLDNKVLIGPEFNEVTPNK